ncbi:hypothetical protein E2C01_015519 [Portunus trituberculatus]|uniref:Uncharacterized protein n=1 Tax=Portunus trituberculatus TaxID=210409 RepID=A0A5B7DN83_PORTR|nr:hypothetical protein [Portunus trituberculatus]
MKQTYIIPQEGEVYILNGWQRRHIPLLDTLLKVVKYGTQAGIVVQHERRLCQHNSNTFITSLTDE